MVEMNVLRFRRGIKNWKTTYEVYIDFEYTADLEKRLTNITFYQPEINRKIIIPWHILEPYLLNMETATYVEPSGLKIRVIDEGLLISDPHFLNIIVHRDQMNAIRIAARNVRKDISESVERILRESYSRRTTLSRI
ncbi:MAG TPA: hypothetical protein EYP86_03515 [Candidatus Altiarchaeales archaeon]|nr:hypothetical protein [Candidatus Altiarchaeales archaeon]